MVVQALTCSLIQQLSATNSKNQEILDQIIGLASMDDVDFCNAITPEAFSYLANIFVNPSFAASTLQILYYISLTIYQHPDICAVVPAVPIFAIFSQILPTITDNQTLDYALSSISNFLTLSSECRYAAYEQHLVEILISIESDDFAVISSHLSCLNSILIGTSGSVTQSITSAVYPILKRYAFSPIDDIAIQAISAFTTAIKWSPDTMPFLLSNQLFERFVELMAKPSDHSHQIIRSTLQIILYSLHIDPGIILVLLSLNFAPILLNVLQYSSGADCVVALQVLEEWIKNSIETMEIVTLIDNTDFGPLFQNKNFKAKVEICKFITFYILKFNGVTPSMFSPCVVNEMLQTAESGDIQACSAILKYFWTLYNLHIDKTALNEFGIALYNNTGLNELLDCDPNQEGMNEFRVLWKYLLKSLQIENESV